MTSAGWMRVEPMNLGASPSPGYATLSPSEGERDGVRGTDA